MCLLDCEQASLLLGIGDHDVADTHRGIHIFISRQIYFMPVIASVYTSTASFNWHAKYISQFGFGTDYEGSWSAFDKYVRSPKDNSSKILHEIQPWAVIAWGRRRRMQWWDYRFSSQCSHKDSCKFHTHLLVASGTHYNICESQSMFLRHHWTRPYQGHSNNLWVVLTTAQCWEHSLQCLHI